MSYKLRSNQQPHPMFGINTPFSVGDLPSGNNRGFVALSAVTVDTTSAQIKHGGNGVELNALFSDGVTSCSIDVVNSEGTLLKTFTGINKFNSGGLFIGYADNGILLGGDPITVRAYNFAGGGGTTIKVRKTS